MLAYKVKEGIYWVGAIDWTMRSFHGYSTNRGSTYNAYLIFDEKITLIDNVKAPFTQEMIQRIRSIVDPSKIEVVISNHGEPDHSGSIVELLKLAPNAKVYSSFPHGEKILKALYGDLPIVPVKSKDTLSIGKRTLQFMQAPMVHWPDNMVTYIPEEKILFSNDIFGQHYSTSKLFDGENDFAVIMQEAKKYYANIVLPYTSQAYKITNIAKDFDIEMIATSHGVIWRDHIKEIMALYDSMTTSQKKEKAVVVFDSMWGSTTVLAKMITEAFMQKGIEVRMYIANDHEHADILTDLMEAKYLAVGSPTLNNTILPTVSAFLTYLKGLAPVGLKYLSFGSYGWGGQSVTIIDKELDGMGYTRIQAPLKQYHVPSEEQLKQMEKDFLLALDEAMKE